MKLYGYCASVPSLHRESTDSLISSNHPCSPCAWLSSPTCCCRTIGLSVCFTTSGTPNCPNALEPHTMRLPPSPIARVWFQPHDTFSTLTVGECGSLLASGWGKVTSSQGGTPSWPFLFQPKTCTSPSSTCMYGKIILCRVWVTLQRIGYIVSCKKVAIPQECSLVHRPEPLWVWLVKQIVLSPEISLGRDKLASNPGFPFRIFVSELWRKIERKAWDNFTCDMVAPWRHLGSRLEVNPQMITV